MNSLIRFKWALTEDRPVIKPYAVPAVASALDVPDRLLQKSEK